MLDPGARTAYTMPTAWALHSGAFNLSARAGLGKMPWTDIAALGRAPSAVAVVSNGTAGQPLALVSAGVNWRAASSVPLYSEVDCCAKATDSELVWFPSCRPMSVMERNFTDSFFLQCKLHNQHAAFGSSHQRALRQNSVNTTTPDWPADHGKSPAAESLQRQQRRRHLAAAAGMAEVDSRSQLKYLTARERHSDGAWHSPRYAPCPP
jgi:hypothetical protein